jgi:hypothetical protein
VTEPGGNTAPVIELTDVRTTADAVTWLHAQAAAFTDAEAAARSPLDAKAFRLASATTSGLADLLPTVDAKTAATVLTSMAHDYAQTSADEAARHDPAFWRATRHLAGTFAAVGAQLTEATRPAHRTQHAGQAPSPDLGPHL